MNFSIDLSLKCLQCFEMFQSESEWKIIFYITAGFYLFGSVFYWFFASGELQPWAVRKEDKNKEVC